MSWSSGWVLVRTALVFFSAYDWITELWSFALGLGLFSRLPVFFPSHLTNHHYANLKMQRGNNLFFFVMSFKQRCESSRNVICTKEGLHIFIWVPGKASALNRSGPHPTPKKWGGDTYLEAVLNKPRRCSPTPHWWLASHRCTGLHFTGSEANWYHGFPICVFYFQLTVGAPTKEVVLFFCFFFRFGLVWFFPSRILLVISSMLKVTRGQRKRGQGFS